MELDYGKFGNCLEGRLYAIRKDQKLNQAEFGKALGVTRSAICNYEGGTRPIGEQIIRSVCREFSVNETWLRSGNGEPYLIPKNGIIDKLIDEYGCSKFEGDFLKAYFQMSSSERMEYVSCIHRLFAPLMSGLEGFNPFAPYFSVEGNNGESENNENPDEESKKMHNELDRQINIEKGVSEESGVS